MSLNLKTKIQGLECPWICKEVLECPWILLALVFGYFLKLFDIQDGHFVELILHVHIWPHYKVTFWTIQRQILLISNAFSSVFSPWICWYMALIVLEFDSYSHVRTVFLTNPSSSKLKIYLVCKIPTVMTETLIVLSRLKKGEECVYTILYLRMTNNSLNDHLSGHITATVHHAVNIFIFRYCVWIIRTVPNLSMTNIIHLNTKLYFTNVSLITYTSYVKLNNNSWRKHERNHEREGVCKSDTKSCWFT